MKELGQAVLEAFKMQREQGGVESKHPSEVEVIEWVERLLSVQGQRQG